MNLTADVVHRSLNRVGSVLRDKWRLDDVLGVGGMATVYAATHRNKKRVAIKMLHTELSIDENVRARFLREGYVANTVGHPGAVTVLDDDVSEDGAAFLVMELLEGETLEMRGERKGKLSVGEVLAITDQLLDILAAAHEKGIVHRDIKPENLFFTVEGRLKVLDFGIAHLREISQNPASVTGTNSFLGTPMYMSPEHARARWKDVDAQSDLWSVGATMFTLLSARGVHVADTVNDQLVLAATTRAPSIATLVSGLPDSVVTLVDRALAYDKADRWPTARAMQGALRKAAADLAAARSDRTTESDRGPPTSSGPSVVFSPELFGEVSQRGTLLSKRLETSTSSATAVSSERIEAPQPGRRSRTPVLFAVGAVAALTLVGTLGLIRLLADSPRVHPSPTEGSGGPPLAAIPAAQPPPSASGGAPAQANSSAPTEPAAAPESVGRPDSNRRAGARPASTRGGVATGSAPSAARSASGAPPAPASAPPKPSTTASPFDRRF